jgi:hypothetical protein
MHIKLQKIRLGIWNSYMFSAEAPSSGNPKYKFLQAPIQRSSNYNTKNVKYVIIIKLHNIYINVDKRCRSEHTFLHN